MKIRSYEVIVRFEVKWQDLWVGLFVKPGHAWLCILPCLPLHVEWYRTVKISDFVDITINTSPIILPSAAQVNLWFGPSTKEYLDSQKYFEEHLCEDEGCPQAGTSHVCVERENGNAK